MLGGEAENQSSPPNLETLPSRHILFSQPLNLHPQPHLSCFLQGLLTLIANLLNHLSIQLLRWSSFPSTPVHDFYRFNSS
ncbi:transposase [Nostoc sp. FACHB-280]|nr:transposase [Nostoc sp. FACHB-280]